MTGTMTAIAAAKGQAGGRVVCHPFFRPFFPSVFLPFDSSCLIQSGAPVR
jgi:hypothetical protein